LLLLSLLWALGLPLIRIRAVSEEPGAVELVGRPCCTYWVEVDNKEAQHWDCTAAPGERFEVLALFPVLQGEQKLFQCSAKLVHDKG